MMYFRVSDYLNATRTALQDLIAPYRYTDDRIVDALNAAMFEISRIRPDIFLDLKYQQPLKKGDTNEGAPNMFMSTRLTDAVPIPAKYRLPIQWYMEGVLQLTDVTDTQDQRAQAFIAKFQTQLMSLSAA
jgi:hypothetical protein